MIPCYTLNLFLLACEHLIRIEEPPLALVYSQNPVCIVKQMADADSDAVRESRAGANSSTHQYPVVFPGHYTKGFMCIVPGSE